MQNKGETVRKIIIVKNYRSEDYRDISFTVPVSDWSEVTDEEYRLLTGFLNLHDYAIVERVDTPSFIARTVKTAIEAAKRHEEEQKKYKEEQERKKQERLLKKKAKDEAAEKKLLEELQKKYA